MVVIGEIMLDVCLLGTGGMMPLPHRWLTSLIVRYNGMSVLIDCGEGTQVALKEKGWSPKPIDVMCFTHFHGDHISGLPGLLLSMGNSERTEPLTLIGPKNLSKVVNALRVIAPELPFQINMIEIEGNEWETNINGLRIQAFRVKHNVTCYGYSLSIDRAGKFNLEAASKLPIPRNYWGKLQRGEAVEWQGDIYTPDMVMGADRKGLKITYTTDTRPCDNIVKYAKGSDLFICEGMYGEPDKQEKAKEHKHMTFQEAAQMAAKADVPELWLTHFSPALVRPKDYIQEARNIFPNTHLGKDGKTIELKFEED